jgi:hypothetical protein
VQFQQFLIEVAEFVRSEAGRHGHVRPLDVAIREVGAVVGESGESAREKAAKVDDQ